MKKTICSLLVLLLVCVSVLLALIKLAPTNQPTNNGGTTNHQSPSSSATKPSGSQPTDPSTTPTDPSGSQPANPSNPVDPTDPAHSCSPESADFSVDLSSHWQLCACGKTINHGAHNLLDGICSVCGADIYTDEYTGLDHLVMYNEFGDPILELSYDKNGQLLTTETYAYRYSNLGLATSKKHYIDGKLMLEMTWDVFGNMLTHREYDENGHLAFSLIYELEYDNNGNVISERHITNDVLTYHAIYSKTESGRIWLQQDAYYLENGSYAVTTYDESGNILSYTCYDHNGDPLDYSIHFDANLCAPLLGTWTGNAILNGNKLGLSEDATIQAYVTMTLDGEGNMVVTLELNEDDYRNALRLSTLNDILTLYGEEMSRAEIDAFFMSAFGMDVETYVDSTVNTMDLTEELHPVWNGVYFYENDTLYYGASWVTFMESCTLALQDSIIYLEDEASETATELSKQN